MALAWASATPAQVIRCTDARTGKVTYTDGSCNGGATVQEVEAKKSTQEILQERQLAAEALERKQQRQEAENANAQAKAQRDATLEKARATRPSPTPDYAHSPECAQSRRHLDALSQSLSRSTQEDLLRLDTAQRQMNLDCLGPQAYADLEKVRAQHPPTVILPSRPITPYPQPYPHVPAPAQVPPRYLTQCGDWRCTDNQGVSYPRTGPGRFPGPGGVCHSMGGQAPC